MPTTGFHSSWITLRSRHAHRILLECRLGFPSEVEEFIARVAVETIDSNCSGDARLVQILNDDKNGIIRVVIASTQEGDRFLADKLRSILHEIFNGGNVQPEFVLVAPGDTGSDGYSHMTHLSAGLM